MVDVFRDISLLPTGVLSLPILEDEVTAAIATPLLNSAMPIRHASATQLLFRFNAALSGAEDTALTTLMGTHAGPPEVSVETILEAKFQYYTTSSDKKFVPFYGNGTPATTVDSSFDPHVRLRKTYDFAVQRVAVYCGGPIVTVELYKDGVVQWTHIQENLTGNEWFYIDKSPVLYSAGTNYLALSIDPTGSAYEVQGSITLDVDMDSAIGVSGGNEQ